MKTQENTEQLGARDFADRVETFVATVTGRPARKLTQARPFHDNGERHYHYVSRDRELWVCVRPSAEAIDAALLTNWLVTASELDLSLQIAPASALYLTLRFEDALAAEPQESEQSTT